MDWQAAMWYYSTQSMRELCFDFRELRGETQMKVALIALRDTTAESKLLSAQYTGILTTVSWQLIEYKACDRVCDR